MNARTDLHAESAAPASPSPSWPSRWRRRLQTWRRPLAVMLPAAGATQAFEAWAAQHPGAAVEVGLSSHCLLMLADDSASEAPRGQALRERAVERWTHYLDLPAQGFDTEWCVQTSLDQGRSPVALACAVPRALCDSLLDVARRHGVKLLSIQPWWLGGLQRAWQGLPPPVDAAADAGQAPSRRWAWCEGAWQTQAHVSAEAGRWVLRSLAFVATPEAADRPDLADLTEVRSDVPTEVFEAPASVSAVVAPMAVQPSAAASASQSASQSVGKSLATSGWLRQRHIDWAESLNFAGPRVRTSFWSWALLALGGIALVHAMELAAQVDEAQQAAQQELSRLQAHARSPVPASGPDAVSGTTLAARAASSASGAAGAAGARSSALAEPAPQLQPDAWRSAAQLAAWLSHPWAEALDHADATAHQRGVALTRWQIDLGTWGTQAAQPLPWRLQAAAPDDVTALAWVQDLGPQAELQRRDALAQPVPSERGTLLWRIDVSAAGGRP